MNFLDGFIYLFPIYVMFFSFFSLFAVDGDQTLEQSMLVFSRKREHSFVSSSPVCLFFNSLFVLFLSPCLLVLYYFHNISKPPCLYK